MLDNNISSEIKISLSKCLPHFAMVIYLHMLQPHHLNATPELFGYSRLPVLPPPAPLSDITRTIFILWLALLFHWELLIYIILRYIFLRSRLNKDEIRTKITTQRHSLLFILFLCSCRYSLPRKLLPKSRRHLFCFVMIGRHFDISHFWVLGIFFSRLIWNIFL